MEKQMNLNEMLWKAVESGRVRAVKQAVKLGADVNEKDENGRTPLMIVCCFGRTEIAALLLKLGADIEAKDNDGWTPIVFASSQWRLDMVTLLLEAGANFETKNHGDLPPCDHMTSGGKEVVKILNKK